MKSPGSPGNQLRTPYDIDFDRIVFSYPFRRLQDKTQVFPLPEHDFVHNRLTHSLEVSSVGRSLGKKVGETLLQEHPELQEAGFTTFDFGAIVAAASLAHDIGNPPFGHSGEAAISDFYKLNPKGQCYKEEMAAKQWHDLTHFEGNAQGFRLLNKKQYQGLKLSAATLATFTKYPRESFLENPDRKRKSQKKYGFFQAEREQFREVADITGLKSLASGEELAWCRHPLAFLVEAADDICYNIIDLEDACRLGIVSFDQTRDFMAAILQDRFKPEKLEKIRSLNEKLGLLRAMAINVLVEQVSHCFISNMTGLLDGTYDHALTDDIDATQVLGDIQTYSVKNIYRSQPVLQREVSGYEVIEGLLETLSTVAFHHRFASDQISYKEKTIWRFLPEELRFEIDDEVSNPYEMLMAINDFISGLTDTYALTLFGRIKGMKPGYGGGIY